MPHTDKGGSPDPLDCIGDDDAIDVDMDTRGTQSSQTHGTLGRPGQSPPFRRSPGPSSSSSNPEAQRGIGPSTGDAHQTKKPRLDNAPSPSPSARAHLSPTAPTEPPGPALSSSPDLPPDSPLPSAHLGSSATQDAQAKEEDPSTPITAGDAPASLPPIASAQVLSGESVSRADVESEREVLPTAHDLIESLEGTSESRAAAGIDSAVATAPDLVEPGRDPAGNTDSVNVEPDSPRPVSTLDASVVGTESDHAAGVGAEHGRASSPVRESMRDEDEGEDEIDQADYHMDVDDAPAQEDSIDTETARLPSHPDDTAPAASPFPRTTSPSKSRKKSGSKPKADQGKPASAASSSKTAPTSKKAAKGKGKTKVDDLKASASAASPSSTSGSTKARSVSVAESVPASVSAASEAAGPSEGTELYCLCRKVFDEEDEEGVMVGCDGCEGWFHPSCIKIPEEDVPMLDLYICPNCEKTTSQRTTWQKVCKRDGCDHSVTGRPSKYCSSACAFQHMAGQIPPQANNKLLRQLSAAFVGLPRPVLGISTTHHHPPGVPSPPPAVDVKMEITQQLAVVNAAIERVKKRQSLIEQVIARCEALGGTPVTSATTSKPSKKKGAQRSSTDDRPCGWSPRLLWDDKELAEWDGQPETGDVPAASGQGEATAADEPPRPAADVCTNPRRRCDRHQGWQKTAPVSVEAELVQLERRKEMMETQLERGKQWAESDAAASAARETMKRHLAGRAVPAG